MVKWFSEKYNSERVYVTPGVFSVLIYNTGQFYEHSGFQANVKQDQQIPSRQVSMVNIFQENHRAFHLNMHVTQVYLLLQKLGRHRHACKIKSMNFIRANNPEHGHNTLPVVLNKSQLKKHMIKTNSR